MNAKERQIRQTIPAVLNGRPVRLVVREHRVEERDALVAHLRQLRDSDPGHPARVIVRREPMQVIQLGELDAVG